MSQEGIYYNKFVMQGSGGGHTKHSVFLLSKHNSIPNNDTVLILKFLLHGQCSTYKYQIFC
jgi:hypothetical protein